MEFVSGQASLYTTIQILVHAESYGIITNQPTPVHSAKYLQCLYPSIHALLCAITQHMLLAGRHKLPPCFTTIYTQTPCVQGARF